MKPATSSPLQFWFEFASTYSYLAAGRIERLCAESGVGIEWRPFLLGPIFKTQGWNDSPFNVYPAQGRYMWRDMERLCERYALRLKHPSRFPRNSVLAARVACLVQEEPWCADFVRAVFGANFAEDREIADPLVIGEILEALGQPADILIKDAENAENKGRLRAQTEQAMALGIFGAPSFVAGGELFWGNDRLRQAVEWMTADSNEHADTARPSA